MTNRIDQAGEPYSIPAEFALTPDETVPSDETAAVDEAPNQLWPIVRELLETVVLSLVIFLLIRQGIQNYRIESHSMEPNFSENEFVLVNKLAYRFGEPKRGDVVVFHNPDNPAEDYIKRIVGLPGDTITFQNGAVYVNDQQLVEPFITEPTYGPGTIFVIEPDRFFVMGDNRDNSRDSRVFGQLSTSFVVGKAWLRVWPFSRFGVVSHQGDAEFLLPNSNP